MSSSQYLLNSTPLASKNIRTSCPGFGPGASFYTLSPLTMASSLYNSNSTPLASKNTSTSCFGFGPGVSFPTLSVAADMDRMGWSPRAGAAVTPFTPRAAAITFTSFTPPPIAHTQLSPSSTNLDFLDEGGFGFGSPTVEGAVRHEYYEDGGAATLGTNAAVAVSFSLNHYHRDLERAKEMKNNEPFFWMIEIVREMATQLNIRLMRLASDKYLAVVSWKDIVGDQRKKTKNGSKKIAAIDLFTNTHTALSLDLSDDQMAVMVKKVQEWIKYYRRRNKKNKLLGWQRMLLSDLERSHGIQIL